MAVKNVLHYLEKEVLVYEHHSNHQSSEPVLSNLQVGLGQQFLRQDLRAYLFSARSGSMRGCSGPTWSTACSQLLSSSDINEPYIYGIKLYEARTRVSRTSECQLISQLNWLFPHFVLCLRRLQQTARVPFSEVAILTPYTAQGNAYRTSLTQLHLEDPSAGYNLVLIKTIDSFQGGEASVVLYDTTATDGPGHQKHCGRLNVAISRARAAMYVVANVGELNKATEVQRGTFSSMNHQASVANRLLLTHYPVTFFNWSQVTEP
ncbi:hypothetical protein BDQ94DRAFT_169739 [Aspergillus welwitschiae]|uniref:DNA2/NAM7 helicase-like C-terminal domain-containing protein n=1 Tax=Aspergillus welwitschiae TaxID=1341132 RepID=A0A3F3Q4W3_9EURO|nr:hypothetical protein BDQ94DRAFT_169739 [Aspergillus welwitschiae]RDH34220.1 hypothetical protein BDQ94DRAFT_169739 [Aspergillus welwitschiae]